MAIRIDGENGMKKLAYIELLSEFREVKSALCSLCHEYEQGDCSTCKWKTPFSFDGIVDYIISEEEFESGIIVESANSGTLFRIDDRFVCAITFDCIMKLADVPYEVVRGFLEEYGENIDEEEWNSLEAITDE